MSGLLKFALEINERFTHLRVTRPDAECGIVEVMLTDAIDARVRQDGLRRLRCRGVSPGVSSDVARSQEKAERVRAVRSLGRERSLPRSFCARPIR